MKNTLILDAQHLEVLEDLNDEQAGQLFKALRLYLVNQEQDAELRNAIGAYVGPDLDQFEGSVIVNHDGIEQLGLFPVVSLAFKSIQRSLDRTEQKKAELSAIRKAAGAAGGNKKAFNLLSGIKPLKHPVGIDNKGKQQLYIVKMYSKEEVYIKVGVTTNRLNVRLSNVKYNYEILLQSTCDDAAAIEALLHNHFFDDRYTPLKKFCGSGECYNVSSLDEILVSARENIE